ncbi:hypothetical protein UFOVP724_50 [uncultured Caudovirales phage]|uniref:Uncharacterized protein n=1 Tax=uncultured Caudovirales phage TaxID=2100421 RepID=A0A6J5NJM5_9CAUD|nr:hypothetical protein UFOVP724_50 [uncultured Caudovirales phage]
MSVISYQTEKQKAFHSRRTMYKIRQVKHEYHVSMNNEVTKDGVTYNPDFIYDGLSNIINDRTVYNIVEIVFAYERGLFYPVVILKNARLLAVHPGGKYWTVVSDMKHSETFNYTIEKVGETYSTTDSESIITDINLSKVSKNSKLSIVNEYNQTYFKKTLLDDGKLMYSLCLNSLDSICTTIASM